MTHTHFFTQLQADIVAASQKAFAEIAAELGATEHVGGFCIATDDGAMTVVPLFAPRSFLETYDQAIFDWQEWPIEYGGDAEFSAICKKLDDFLTATYEDDDFDFAQFKQELLNAMFNAAQQLRQILPLVQPFVLLLGITDSNEFSNWHEMIKQLNNAEINARFSAYLAQGEA